MDETAIRDTGGAAPPDEIRPEGSKRTPRPAGAVSFVVIFLVVTFVLLSAGRYAVNTEPINWYLFQVANNTAWVLGIIGDYSEVEDPAMYRDRAADVRAALKAWKAGSHKVPTAETQDSTAPPLTSWEVWQYRSMLLAKQLEQTNSLVERTSQPKQVKTASDAERMDALRKELNRLTDATHMEGPAGTMQVMAPQLAALIDSSETTLAALEKGGQPEGVPVAQVLDQLQTQIESGLKLQHKFLQDRATQLSIQVHDRHGPTVLFIARKGLLTQVNDAKEELAKVKTDTQLPTAAREAQVQRIQARIDTLTARRESVTDPKERAALDKDVLFRFNVVPDCGALPSMSIFLAAMIAFPTRFWKRLAGLAIGLPLLYLINIARLSCLAVIGAYSGNGELFEFAHEYVWQAVYIIFVVIIWLLWVELLVRPREIWRRKAA